MLKRLSTSLRWRVSRLAGELAFALKRLTRSTVKVEGLQIPIGSHLSRLVLKSLEAGDYESLELSLLKRYLRPDDRVMELGAGLGFLSAYCARVVGSGNVLAFEANPFLEEPILELYRLNGVSPRLKMSMLASHAGFQTFHVDRHFCCSSALGQPSDPRRQVQVPTLSFQDEVADFEPTFLIVDIEGGEVELLCDQNLTSFRVILVEMHPEIVGNSGLDQLRKWLFASGFQPGGDPLGQVEVFCRDQVSELPHGH